MAEAVVQFVVEKLANFVANELKHLGGVGGKVQMMQNELIRIQSCLKDSDTKHKGDARVQNWLNELRDVAYRIEDATDTFLVEVEDRRQKFLNKMFHNTIKVKTLHKLGTDLDNIQNELNRISKSRDDYGIVAVQDIVGEETIWPFRRETYQEVDDTEVVGMEADKKNILQLMLPGETPRRAVITIVGAGGLGKTTLAHMVYRSAKEKFEYHIMLSISQQYSLIELVTKMLLKLNYSIPENQGLGDLISTLKSFLNDRRYLIILDDVWKEDLWIQLKDILPDVNNGSRVLMTSRIVDVAKSADSQIPPYELYFLDSKKSLDLLLKKALPNQKPEECHSNLLDLAKQLSKKCKGLPLALIVLGGILLKKRGDYLEWERVLRTFDWYSDCKGCMDVLAMSYQDMPYYLKACFMYLAFFPEDYEISATNLIGMWIAEGFIPCKETATKEQMAERYLDELFERSMIQVSRRSTYGLIKSFRVHDLLRDLAIHEARQQNFLTVFAQASDVNQPNRKIRRASLQYHVQPQQKNPQFMEYLGPNTRSFLVFVGFDNFIETQMPKFSNFRLLKVLDLVDVKHPDVDLAKEFEKLIHLKYLRFRRCFFNFSSFSFHRMKTLETLDFRQTRVKPNLSWTSGTLRHVRCDMGVLELPNSTVDLRNLQTMKWVSIPRSLDTNLILLNNLRKLGVCGFEDLVGMTNLLGKLSSLVSLAIKQSMITGIPMEIVYPKALPNYQNLRSLYLDGGWSWTATLDASLFPPRLIKLTLHWCSFQQNPMPELGKLKNLKKLSLQNVMGVFSKVSAICSEGFPVLQYLKVADGWFEDLVVEKEVMPMLTYLEINPEVKLRLPPELQHVTVQKSNYYYYD